MPSSRIRFRQINHFLLKHRLLLFLTSLLLLLILFPIIHEKFNHYIFILELFFSLILVTGIYIVSTNREILTIAILLAILTICIFWYNLILDDRRLLIAGLCMEIIFFVLTTTTILSHVLQYKRVTADKIYGAICGYLLIGIMWAILYTIIESLSPGSFHFNHGVQGDIQVASLHRFYFAHFIYFSFVTLTTLGFGEITPLNSIARLFSSLEAVVGQLYIAILIARLVGLHISHTYLSKK